MPVVKYIARSATSQPSRSTWLFTKNTLFLQSGTVQKASMASLSTQKSAWNNEEDKANINPIAAIAQLRSTADKFKNLVDVATCARFAKAKGASMLFLPECFGFMGESSSQTLDEAEHPTRLSMGPSASTASRLAIGIKAESSVEINSNELREEELELTRILKSIVHNTGHDYGDTDDHNQDTTIPDGKSPAVSSLMDGLRTIAKESGLWISGGGIHVAGAPPEVDNSTHRVYNTHVILDSSGNLKAQYQKIHLFDVSIPGKVELRESKTTAPGTELIACDSPVGRLGVTICYDLRFPEMYTELTQTMGAQILLVPSAFTVPTGAAHWHALLRARAIENQCYVLAAAQYGKHNDKRVSFGHSLAVDPWGKVIADAGGYPTTEEAEVDQHRSISPAPPDPPSIVTVEIDLCSIDSIRQRMPIDVHRSNAAF